LRKFVSVFQRNIEESLPIFTLLIRTSGTTQAIDLAGGLRIPLDEPNDVLAFELAFRVLADSQAYVWEQRSQGTTEFCDTTTKLHLSAALWWYLFAFVMPGIGECNPPVPEGPFPLSQSSPAQGLQQVGQRRVQRAVKRMLVEAIVSQAGEEL
jgi:hypothetical protein